MTRLIAGVDEAGRGPLAGPVVAAAVVFDEGYRNSDFKDSKQLSARRREYLFDIVKAQAKAWSIVAVGHQRIRALNIREAARLAMSLAVRRVGSQLPGIALVLVDGNMPIVCELEQETVVHGDRLRVEISAASILAKVWRDRLMLRLHDRFPWYGFAGHMGYPTAQHRQAIADYGPCPVHRVDFRGVREFAQLQYCKTRSHSPVETSRATVSPTH